MNAEQIINKILDAKQLSLHSFEQAIGVSNGAIRKQLKSGKQLSSANIEKIVATFPDVNPAFLLTGKGRMYNKNIEQANEEETGGKLQVVNKSRAIKASAEEAQAIWQGVPVYDVPISASFVSHYRDEFYEPLYYLRDKRFKDCDFASVITGDSMHSEIRHGDYVVCKEITDTRFIDFGAIYYVVATNGLETCKYLHPVLDDDDMLMLVPYNKSVPASPIPKDMILRLYRVKGIVRGY